MKKPRLINELPWGPRCSDCPYRTWSRGYTLPQLKKDALLAIVGEASGYWEILEGVPFAGQSGGWLNAKLAVAGLSRIDVSILNPCRCRPIKWEMCSACSTDDFFQGPGHVISNTVVEEIGGIVFETPTFDLCSECAGLGMVPSMQGDNDHANATPEPGQIIECMRRYGHDDLKSLTKKQLILGMGASALFALTGKDNIGDHRGHLVDTPHGQALITYHPAFLMRGAAEMEPAVVRDFSRIPAIIAGVEGINLEVVYTRQTTEEQINELIACGSPSIDIENPGGVLRTAAGSTRPGQAVTLLPGQQQLAKVLGAVEAVVGQYFYAHDAWYLARDGYTIPRTIIDTQVLGHLANPNTPHDIGFLQTRYADPPMGKYWKEDSDYAGDLEGVALRDVDATNRILVGLRAELVATEQWELAEHCIIPWTHFALELRQDGVRCDTGLLAQRAAELDTSIRARGAELSERSGVPIPKKSKTGIPSPQGIKKHLYDTLGLPVQYHRKTHEVTTDEPALKKLRTWCWRNGHEAGLYFIDAMIGRPDPDDPTEWIGGLKQESTEAKGYRQYAQFGLDSGSPVVLLHPFVNLTGTETGRLAYSDPNMQQMAPRARSAVLPDEGHIFIEADYKQIQFLIMLYEAREWTLLRQGLEGKDFHKLTAADFFNVHYDHVTPAQKTAIKPISLGRLFGKGVKTTAEDMDKTEKEVQEIFDAYDRMIPGLAVFQAAELQSIESRGYIQTEYGWRRYFNREDREHSWQNHVATEAYNLRIQSNEAMVVREAMLRLRDELARLYTKSEARIVLMKHDSVLVSCLPSVAEVVALLVRDVLSAPARKLPCPEVGMPDGLRFPVTLTVGKDWGTMVKWEQRREVL